MRCSLAGELLRASIIWSHGSKQQIRLASIMSVPKFFADNRAINNLILTGECIDNSRIQTDRDDELVNVLKQFWETENISTKSNELEKPNKKEFLSDTRFTGKRYEIGQ